MLYSLTKNLALRLMKAPTEAPDAPAGRHDAVQVFRASPGFLSYRLLAFWLIFLLNWLIPFGLILVGMITGEAPPLWIGIVLIPVLAVIQFFVYFTVRIDYDMRYYIVTDRSLRVREGAVIVREKTISFANVQNIRIVQGPLLRLFGIWHLELDTAGGGSSDPGKQEEQRHRVRMAGIENAAAVRDQIRERLRLHGRSAGLGDLDDHDDDGRAFTSPALLEALRGVKEASAALRTAAEKR